MATLVCAACGTTVIDEAALLPEECALNMNDGEDMVLAGHYAISTGEFAPEKQGDFLVNLGDLCNTRHHDDPSRLNGCCGLDGCDGYNLVCSNGHEVGTERSDCWLAHYAVLDGGKVEMK